MFHLWILCSVTLALTSGANSMCVWERAYVYVCVCAHVSTRIAVRPLSVVSAAQEIILQKLYITALEDCKLILLFW